MSCPYANCHSSETGRWAVQYGLSFYSDPAGHGAGGVVRAAGVGIQRVLTGGTQERTVITSHVWVTADKII